MEDIVKLGAKSIKIGTDIDTIIKFILNPHVFINSRKDRNLEEYQHSLSVSSGQAFDLVPTSGRAAVYAVRTKVRFHHHSIDT